MTITSYANHSYMIIFQEGVIAEINIMKSLKSPFIIRLYATFQDKQRVFMLTSLLQGGELEAVMGDKAMEDSVAAFYAAGILEGLTYMHRRHIIHRDLKPENVLIDSKGYPVLIDLGFAKYVAEKTYTVSYILWPPYAVGNTQRWTSHMHLLILVLRNANVHCSRSHPICGS